MSDQGSPPPKEGNERRSQSPSPNDGGEAASPRDRERSNSPGARGGDDDGASRSAQAPDVDAVNPGNNIYVANLPHRLAQQDLEDMFSKFGRLERCELIIDPVTRESRGFAFVTFEDLRDAEDAIKELNGKELQGRRVRVEVAKRRRGHDKTPGKYLGPRLASSKYGEDRGRGYGDRDGGRRGGRSRSRSRDRHARDRYDDRDRHDRGRYEDRGRRRSYDRYDDRRRR